MHKTVAMELLYPVIEEKIRSGGYITLTTTGYSMLPMLHHQRDIVVLGPVINMPNINDVVLYRRYCGKYVMHRIVSRDKNGDYTLCGDNQNIKEHHIQKQQILGILIAFTRKGRYISCSSFFYKAYVCLLPVLRILRRGLSWSRMKRKDIRRLLHH